MLEIKRFQENDIDAVFKVQQAAYLPLFEKYRDTESNPYMESREKVLQKYTRVGTQGYVFLLDGEAVGAVRINLYPEYRSGRVSALCVHPMHQGKGIAQQALSRIEQMHADVRKWFLDTILQEKGNCHLYEKIGYRQTGKTEKISDQMTLVFYEKKKQAEENT